MLAELILAYRCLHHLSTRDLSKVIGVSHTALWRLEKGEEVSARQWVRVVMWCIQPPPPMLPKTVHKQKSAAESANRASAAVLMGVA
jgi:hypothetical protein